MAIDTNLCMYYNNRLMGEHKTYLKQVEAFDYREDPEAATRSALASMAIHGFGVINGAYDNRELAAMKFPNPGGRVTVDKISAFDSLTETIAKFTDIPDDVEVAATNLTQLGTDTRWSQDKSVVKPGVRMLANASGLYTSVVSVADNDQVGFDQKNEIWQPKPKALAVINIARVPMGSVVVIPESPLPRNGLPIETDEGLRNAESPFYKIIKGNRTDMAIVDLSIGSANYMTGLDLKADEMRSRKPAK